MFVEKKTRQFDDKPFLQNKVRGKTESNLICGLHSVVEAIKQDVNNVSKLFCSPSGFLALEKAFTDSEILKSLEDKREIKNQEQLFALCNYDKHQGLVLAVKNVCLPELENLSEHFSKILVLDSIQDPQNLGSIIRTAAVFGFAIVIDSDYSSRITAVVSKVASGGLSHVPVIYMSNVKNFVLELKKNTDFHIIAIHENAENEIKPNLKEKVCLVLGSEEEGIRPSLIEKCHESLKIEGKGLKVLNVAQAAAIAMFSFA
jgi:23S rRNA (guanosine2251-2'-O)-methyltransferase